MLFEFLALFFIFTPQSVFGDIKFLLKTAFKCFTVLKQRIKPVCVLNITLFHDLLHFLKKTSLSLCVCSFQGWIIFSEDVGSEQHHQFLHLPTPPVPAAGRQPAPCCSVSSSDGNLLRPLLVERAQNIINLSPPKHVFPVRARAGDASVLLSSLKAAL